MTNVHIIRSLLLLFLLLRFTKPLQWICICRALGFRINLLQLLAPCIQVLLLLRDNLVVLGNDVLLARIGKTMSYNQFRLSQS